MLGELNFCKSRSVSFSIPTDSVNFLQVIDEIDGALGEGKGAVDVILKMVFSPPFVGHKFVCLC